MTAIPRELRSDFKAPSPAEAARLWDDICLFGTCVRDGQGRRVPIDHFYGLGVIIDPSVPANEIHIVEPTGVRHRITNIN